MSQKKHHFLFSVIIPVYNAAEYIEETVASVTRQSINFEKYCEIILVDDGSTDDSEKVCTKLVAQFPKNIRYIKQKNAGPGAARNNGISLAKGKYINLLDSDDLWSVNTFEDVYNFLESHNNEIDLVTTKIDFFEAKTGPHPLNYRFTTDRIVDLKDEYEAINSFVTASFFKREVFETHTFDPSVGRYAEDLHFMGKVLLDKMKYGIITKPTYYYRKRVAATSSQDINKTDKFWYLETPKRTLLDLLLFARKQHKEIPKFIQFNVMYDLAWRLKQTKQDCLNSKELQQYIDSLITILSYIDDDMIISQKVIDTELKLYALSLKYAVDAKKEVQLVGTEYRFRDTPIFDSRWLRKVRIDIIEHEKTSVTFHGFMRGVLMGNDKLICSSGGKTHNVQKVVRPYKKRYFLGRVISDHDCFEITIPINNGDHVEFKVETASDNKERSVLEIETGRYAKLPAYTKIGSYCSLNNDYLMIHPNFKQLIFLKKTWLRTLKHETLYELFLLIKLFKKLSKKAAAKHKNQAISVTPNTHPSRSHNVKKASKLSKIGRRIKTDVFEHPIVFRLAYFITKPFVGEIWLVSDRVTAADDNGEVFFKYLMTQPQNRRKVYFCIDKNTDDYKRIREYGPVVDYLSFKYKLLFLHASKNISSEATEFVLNPFFGKGHYLWDLYGFDFVFLQHGIIRDDISEWLNKYSKNIKLFITSVRPEYESVVNGNYGYTKKEVALTGLARYDNLINEPKNKLVIMPTWRQNIVGKAIEGTDLREYNPDFKDSDFFKFWNTVLTDKRLEKAMAKKKMKGELYLHHTLRSQAKDFTKVKHIKRMEFPYNYPRAKKEGSLLLTDYSSVALDFAYLKKPIIYAQFDSNTYYDNYVGNAGYMSYEEEGLGPVTYNIESTIKRIIKYLNEDCKMEEKYLKRVDNFFYKFDTKNSERIFQAILAMDSDRNKTSRE